ncbi:MAG TPA: FxDxF family PEP-CTERM protein [Albitalea sp.]|jgi:hypothetical protein|nr:FxDxF family PEP-CTERM protein [Albitalea sp.]
MKFKSIVTALVLSLGVPTMALACTSTFSLGTLNPSGVKWFGNDFDKPQGFTDCYTFTLSQSPSSATTTTLEWEWSNRLHIDVASVTLSGGSLLSHIADTWTESWTFGDLSAGTYQLNVIGSVTNDGSRDYDDVVGYWGLLSASGSNGSSVTPVPEPETLAMLALGLGAVVWGARRKA